MGLIFCYFYYFEVLLIFGLFNLLAVYAGLRTRDFPSFKSEFQAIRRSKYLDLKLWFPEVITR